VIFLSSSDPSSPRVEPATCCPRKLAGCSKPPLPIFCLCTGARLSEALELEWREVDLAGRRAIFWKTKGGRRRVAELQPAAVDALSALPHRDGRVFLYQPPGRTKAPRPYVDRNRDGGGQIKTAWRGAIKRAGLAAVSPHDLRHTWASWHYGVHKDLLALKVEGGWSSVALVERYAHLMPAGQEGDIRAFWSSRPRAEPAQQPQEDSTSSAAS
jgi:integrase